MSVTEAPSETKGARYFGAQPQRPPELKMACEGNGAPTSPGSNISLGQPGMDSLIMSHPFFWWE